VSNLAGIEREGKLERLADPEIDAVGVVEHAARNAFAVHPGSVAAIQILDRIVAVFRENPKMVARNAIVSQNEIASRMAADEKRELADLDARALPGWIQHQKRCWRLPGA
jgi:hypothetical protein